MGNTEKTAQTTLADVLNPDSDEEQCTGCNAVYEWDHARSYCPYHQGLLAGYDQAMGEIAEAAGAFQRDPELIDHVIDRAEQMRVRDYELAQQAAANQPQPEGLSEHEHEVLNNSYADAEESPSSRWPDEVTVEIPGECLNCGLQYRRWHPTTATVSCAHCRYVENDL